METFWEYAKAFLVGGTLCGIGQGGQRDCRNRGQVQRTADVIPRNRDLVAAQSGEHHFFAGGQHPQSV